VKSSPEQTKSPTDAGILAYLARHGGSVQSTDARGVTFEMAKALGFSNRNALNVTLRRMEKEGAIIREVGGRRTVRVCLADSDRGVLNDAASKRQAILDFLSRHGGSLESAEGRGLTGPMADAVGCDSLAELNGMLERMVKEGVIERVASGGRTFRIALVKPPTDGPVTRSPIPVDRPRGGDALAELRGAQQDLQAQVSAAATTMDEAVRLGAELSTALMTMQEALRDLNARVTALERSSQTQDRGSRSEEVPRSKPESGARDAPVLGRFVRRRPRKVMTGGSVESEP
jgi:hypothetical protein